MNIVERVKDVLYSPKPTDVIDVDRLYTIPEFLDIKGLTIREVDLVKANKECLQRAQQVNSDVHVRATSPCGEVLYEYYSHVMDDVITSGDYL